MCVCEVGNKTLGSGGERFTWLLAGRRRSAGISQYVRAALLAATPAEAPPSHPTTLGRLAGWLADLCSSALSVTPQTSVRTDVTCRTLAQRSPTQVA